MTPISGLPSMGAAEARNKLAAVRISFAESRRLLLELRDRNGWKSLGYETWEACVDAELDQSYRQVKFLIAAGRVEQNIASGGSTVPPGTPTRHLLPLTNFTPQQQQEAWSEIESRLPPEERTQKTISALVDRLFAEMSPEERRELYDDGEKIAERMERQVVQMDQQKADWQELRRIGRIERRQLKQANGETWRLTVAQRLASARQTMVDNVGEPPKKPKKARPKKQARKTA